MERYFQTLNITQCIEGNSYKYAHFENDEKFFKFRVEKEGPAVITLTQHTLDYGPAVIKLTEHTLDYESYPTARMMLF